MIEIKVNKGHCQTSASGQIIQLLAELPIGVGQCLYRILKDAPDDKIRETLIKIFFEQVLHQMKLEGENDDEC